MPWLARVLARARAEPAAAPVDGGAPHLSWLWRQFGGAGAPVTAPYALRALDADADCGAQCWHIDPVHFAFARDHLLVAPLEDARPAPEEEDVLARHVEAALHEHAEGARPRLHRHRGHWLLALARHDKHAAEEALAGLSLEHQLALVCEAPAGQRARLLELLPQPEAAVPLLPDAELVFTVKAVGLDDGSWLLEHATPRQLATCFDLDAWQGLDPDRGQLAHWFAVIAEAGEETLVRAAHAIDPEVLALYLRDQIDVMLDPKDDDWQPPPGEPQAAHPICAA